MKKIYYILTIIGFILIISGLLIVYKNTNDTANTVLVIFKDENNKTLFKERIEIGKTITSKNPAERKNEIFIGWYLENEEYDFTTPVSKELVLIGRWEDKFVSEKTYTVEFYIDEELYEKQEVVVKDKASKPEPPVKKDYQFLGWYQGNQLYNFNSPVVKDIKLIAKFQIIELPEPEIPNENENNPTLEPSIPPIEEKPDTPIEEEPAVIFVKETGIETEINSITMRKGDIKIINAKIVPENSTIKDLLIYCENSLVCNIDSEKRIQVVKEGQTNIIIETYHGIKKVIPITIKPGYRTIENQDGTYFIIGTDFENMAGTVTLRYKGEPATQTVYISKQGIPATKKIDEIIKVELDD